MHFKPNFDLLVHWGYSKKSSDFAGANAPFVAIFKHENKTLVYMCDRHWANISFNMVDMCFADDFDFKPDVLLMELPNKNYEQFFDDFWVQYTSVTHAALLASKKNIPVVFADLSFEQRVDLINRGFPDNQIKIDEIKKVFNCGGPNPDGTIYQKMSAHCDIFGRDRFMLQNIAEALNKYDTVFALFGTGHYESQRLVLEDMLGKPEYITRIKNMRCDFSDVKINPIKLCNFEEMEKNDKDEKSN